MNRNTLGFLLFILAIMIGVGAVYPKVRSVHMASVQKDAELKVVALKKQRLERLKLLNQTFDTESVKVGKVLSALPNEPAYPEALVSLETIARESGVLIQSLLPQTDTDRQEISITLAGDGGLANVEKFLDSLASNDRPISIAAVSITKANAQQVSFTMTVRLPFVDVAGATQ
ncbi:MAG TPA: type 4a pilus biogenesis protein PilO [Patescibacteria group bacterium]